MKLIKKYFPILILISFVILITAFIMVPYIIEGKAFVIGFDSRTQYRLFFIEFRRLIVNAIKQKTFPFWSWNMFFGNNFLAAKSYYIFGDIYSYLGILINNHYYNIVMILSVLKFISAALSFYIYGRVRNWDKYTRILGALLFTFSAWALKYVEVPIYLSFYSFVPLYFASLELAMKKKVYFFYAIMTALMLIMNFYLFYTLSIFTLIYYTYRFFEEHRKQYLKSAFPLIALYLLGFLLSAILIVPGVLLLLQNSRLFNSTNSHFYFEDIRVYFHLLIAHFVPSSTFISQIVNNNGIEQYTSIYESITYQTRELMLFSGSFTALMLGQSIFDKENKLINRIFYSIMIILLVFPIGGSFMHGLSEHSFRWTLFLIFLNIVLAMKYFNKIEFIDLKILKKTSLIISLLIFLNIPVLSMILNVNPFNNTFQWIVFIITIIFIWVIYFVLFKDNKNKKTWIIIISVVEIIFASYLTFNMNPNYKKLDWDFVNKSETVLGKTPDQLNQYLQELDGDYGYYRIYAPYDSIYWYSSLNMNLLYNYSDVKTYDSTYQYSVDNLSKLISLDRGFGWTWNITNPDIIDFASVKYSIVTSESELPHSNFILIGDFYGLPLYLNNQYRPIANSYNFVISYDDYVKNPDISLINQTIIADENDVEIIKTYLSDASSASIKNVEKYQNLLLGDIYSEDRNFVVTSIAFDKGWKVTVNNESVPIYAVNGGFVGFPINAGDNTIKMYFMPEGFKLGAITTFIGFILLIFLIFFEVRKFFKHKNKQQNLMKFFKIKRNLISLTLIPIVFIFPMLLKGIPSGHDLIYHFSRIVGSFELLRSNISELKILPGFYYGYGYPVNLFYPLGLFYIPVYLMDFGLSLILSYKIFAVIITLLTALSMYWTSKYLFKSSSAALLASFLYTFSVYRNYTDFFERAALGEWVAFIFVPLVFLGLYKIINDEKPRAYLLAFSMSGLILTHTITTIVMVIILFIFALFNYKILIHSLNKIKQILFAIFITLGLTAFYWLPLLEMMFSDTFQYQTPWTNLHEHVINNIFQLVFISPQLAVFPNGIEWYLFLIPIIGLIFRFKSIIKNQVLLFSFIISLATLFIVSNVIPINWISFLNFIQFPFRLYFVLTFFLSILTAYFINEIVIEKGKWIQVLTLVLISVQYLYMTNYYYNVKMIGYWYDNFPRYSIEYYYAEFLPESADMDNLAQNASNKVINASNPIEISYSNNQLNYVVDFNQGAYINTQLELPLLYYKGYGAFYDDNGKYILLKTTKDSKSLLNVDLGDIKEGRLYIFYNGTLIQKISGYLSAIFVGLISVIFGLKSFEKIKGNRRFKKV